LTVSITPVFRGAAAVMAVATIGIALELLRTRRLADVEPTSRFPEGTRRPRLLICLQTSE
jgi:hypothetical protein